MENLPLGTKVFLQPVLSDTESVITIARKLNLKHFSKANKQQFNNRKIHTDKRKIAQELYYSQKNQAKNKGPVHARLGGPEYKRRGFKHIWGFNQENYVKPRIKKGSNGIMTARYYEKAQNRLRLLQKQINHPQYLQVQFKNNGTKYPCFFHSLKNCLNANIQNEIRLLQESSEEIQEVDSDEPLFTDDVTEHSLNQRFSLYP